MTQSTAMKSVEAIQRAPEFDVPPDETPAATCQHCGWPFKSERALALHLGRSHAAELDQVEAAAFERATELEDDELFFYHAKVVGALGAMYSIVVLLYMIAFGSGVI
jgi:hypothetical protein